MKISVTDTVDVNSQVRILVAEKDNPASSVENSNVYSAEEKEQILGFLKQNDFEESFCLWHLKTIIRTVDELTLQNYRQAAGHLAPTLKTYKPEEIVLDTQVIGAENSAAFTEALILAQYKFTKFKDEEYKTQSVVLFGADEAAQTEVEKSVSVATSANLARDVANSPANHMTPVILAEKAAQVASEKGLGIEVLDEAKMRELGMNALLAVSAGSVHEARLICLKYTHPEAEKTIALVGKGLTFDAGGVCLKPSRGMSEMKFDKSGAAAVLGAISHIADVKPKINVVTVIPSSENVTGAAAYKPGDVITAYNGKTIEVINTDAEGRMILCDALAYAAEQFKPDKMINIATLTGASISALGHGVAAVMGNCDDIPQELVAAGKRVAEPVWEMPISPTHHEILKSEVAEIKHTVDGPEGSLMIGAAFLSNFVNDGDWCAIDIGATAWKFRGTSYISREGASGFGCRLLSSWVLSLAK